MENKLDKLIAILESEKQIYDQFIELADEKTQILIKSAPEQLSRIVTQEEKLLKDLKIFEAEREQIFQGLCVDIGIDSTNSTITQIIQKVDTRFAELLSDIQASLIEKIETIQTINHKNQLLIQNAIEYVDFSLNILSNAKTSMGDNNYGQKGEVTQKSKKSMLDVKL